MDVRMPRMGGLEATQKIPIIGLTADVVESTETRCRQAGMDDYLHKPFRYEEFTSKVERRCLSDLHR